MTDKYKIAGHIIQIESIYEDVHVYCRDYVCDAASAAEIFIRTDADDIAYERNKSARENELEGTEVIEYSDGYLEELAVYRKLAEKILEYNTFLFHGSAIAVDNEAYLFTAKSGTGKSTHARLWREYLGSRAVMVNDDKPLIHIENGKAFVYGTPYNGKHRLGSNICVPLKAIAVLERGQTNSISRAERSAVYPLLLQQTYRPSDRSGIIKTLDLLNEMTHSVELYILRCNMEPDAARVSYEGMK